MFPKSLVDICVDAVVAHTLYLQDYYKDTKIQYARVKDYWRNVWQLPGFLAERCSQTLHCYMTHKLKEDVTREFLILLAADVKYIRILPHHNTFLPMGIKYFYNQCNFNSDGHRLRELDVSGIKCGGASNTLVVLLPLCPNLKVLKLGDFTVFSVLMAAKKCPLTVLHLRGRPRLEPKLCTQAFLMSVLIGSKDTVIPQKLLKTIKMGITPNLEPAWPDLADLAIERVKLSRTFFVLALHVLSKLRSLSFDRVDQDPKHYMKYFKVKSLPGLPSVHLKFLALIERDQRSKSGPVGILGLKNLIAKDFVLPALETDSPFENVPESNDIPVQIKELYMMHERQTICYDVLREQSPSIGGGVVLLELYDFIGSEFDLRNIIDVLVYFPRVKELRITFGLHLSCNPEMCVGFVFPNVTSIVIDVTTMDYLTLRFMAMMFPSIKDIQISILPYSYPLMIRDLTFFPKLRTIKLCTLHAVNINDLCSIPRPTEPDDRWTLIAPMEYLSDSDRKRLLASGWNYLPVANYSFCKTAKKYIPTTSYLF